MNLWNIYPESLLRFEWMFYLQYPTLLAYLILILSMFKYINHRKQIALFIVLTLIANIYIFSTAGPGMGRVMIPLLLVSLVLLPLSLLFRNILLKATSGIMVYSLMSIAGLLHCLSWFTWLIALANS
ncbi:hypothetical protein [Vibrio sp. HN007]|uniref:hypothetical protein n=1 Tax=Vibrio iocasae TaxID=3098914 RepID=UPI0035D47F6B